MTDLDKEEIGLRRHGKLMHQGGAGKKSGTRSAPGTRSGASSASRSFAIMRTAKIKTLGNMGASLSHTFRERDTPNADPDRIHDNTVLVGADNVAGVMKSWHNQAPDKIRKNAVHGLEYFVGGSPHHINGMTRQEQDQYFTKALDWLKDRHGDENILSAVIHRDETTPHLTVMTIPIDEKGKLNARHFVGSKKDLSQLQTDFAENVGAEFGFERGVRRSQAKHQRVKRFYDALQHTPETILKLPERDLGRFLGIGKEKDAEYRERLSVASVDALAGQKAAYDKKIRDLENMLKQKDEVLLEKNQILDDSFERNDQLGRDLEQSKLTINQAQTDLQNAKQNLSENYRVFQNLGVDQKSYDENIREYNQKIEDTRILEEREAKRKAQQVRARDLDDDYGFD